MPLSFQCRETFKLVCTWNQTRLVNFFPPELSKMNSKMSKDGAAVLTITCRVRFRTHEYTAHLFPS